jgi:hypothetical protein
MVRTLLNRTLNMSSSTTTGIKPRLISFNLILFTHHFNAPQQFVLRLSWAALLAIEMVRPWAQARLCVERCGQDGLSSDAVEMGCRAMRLRWCVARCGRDGVCCSQNRLDGVSGANVAVGFLPPCGTTQSFILADHVLNYIQANTLELNSIKAK